MSETMSLAWAEVTSGAIEAAVFLGMMYFLYKAFFDE